LCLIGLWIGGGGFVNWVVADFPGACSLDLACGFTASNGVGL
jgi:hypothetical protein